jgi:hypothetical protein
MASHSTTRGQVLSQDDARAIWLPLIATNKTCQQCGIEVMEFSLSESGPLKASPQRPDPTNPSYVNNCVVFCMFCNYFNNDTPDSEIQALLSSTLPQSNPLIRLPSEWTPDLPIPAVPNPIAEDVPVDPAFLKWLDGHIGNSTSRGIWFAAENYRKNTPLYRDITITVTRNEVIKLYRDNGGNYCRFMGVKGNWEVNSPVKLTIDKIDPSKGYIAGNLMIMLVKCNNAKWHHPIKFYPDLLKIRDCLLERFS